MPFPLTMPKLSPTMTQGTIIRWFKEEGEFIESGDLLIEVATDKASVEYNAIDSGWLRKILVGADQEAAVNDLIAIFSENEGEAFEELLPKKKETAPKAEQIAPVEEKEAAAPLPTLRAKEPEFQPEAPRPLPKKEQLWNSDHLFATPLARKLAKKQNLDLSTVTGSGPGGRIIAKDLERAQHLTIAAFKKSPLPHIAAGSYEEETPTPMRKVIGQRLKDSKASIPHFTVALSIDADPLIQIREQLKNWEIKVTFNDLIVRATALALRQHPLINSGFNSVKQTLIRFKTVDISVAVSLDGGLITPIIRHADYKNLHQISAEVKELVKKAKTGKLEAHEYQGGSFTISNLGMYGIDSFQAIINPPQAAILAVAGIQDVPRIKNGQIYAGKTMQLTLSSDHRVIDGSLAAEFLSTLKKLLENPAILTL
ncbi:MAG: pdhC [Chlamydiales bacterium]|jgi:pyruvate dehydrogenase E2 component (dihydrolipoamide acetyltransferase)|nr:pdhC [Chlamydiales bacterium]